MTIEQEKTIRIIREGKIPLPMLTHRVVGCNICQTIFEVIEEEYETADYAAGQTIIRVECPLCRRTIDVIIKDQ